MRLMIMSDNLARKAVGEMKRAMNDAKLAPSAARGLIMTNLDDGVYCSHFRHVLQYRVTYSAT